MAITISVLDQSPIYPGETPEEAFQHTVKLAQLSERLGFRRFWVSEHHDSEQVAGSSPEVLISYLLAKTERIRIGSGGIMLQHYSPYKVAENFNVLATLAPGRVDLGVGRAPGGLPRSTQALRQGGEEAASLTDKIIELEKYVHNRLEADHPLFGLKAGPIPGTPPELYVLGASVASAEIAAELGLPYVFSLFIGGDQAVAVEAIRVYQSRFDISQGKEPQAILALAVLVAESEEEARELAGAHKLIRIHLASGKTLTVATREQAEEFTRQSEEAYTLEEREPEITKGTKESVREQLLALAKASGVEEFIVTTNVQPFDKRVRSFELLREAFAEVLTTL
ncbi:alkane 1-monooxygenase [Paenibacillus sp. P3E]|uniref:LLM class flavin-dependent oxidoreductase n=1 Tax=unclassified Paenibacillus TaxID=185978 RepID=UPI00093B9285|nr:MULTISPECIES: LLM class flavin-dependent oxidoreductase [unclassified Paenibacillus]OKP77302.1 alkane 1-monooxygenase [Paenibacillus sp. P3E]OKP89425.1 alkane 1-monooxygenase [Paenibacillus sp. P32E]